MVKENTDATQAGETTEPGAEVAVEVETAGKEEAEGEADKGDDDGESQSENKPEGDAKKDEPFSKKAVNALNRVKREKRQLRAQVKALEAKIAELNGASPDASLKAPDPKDFDSYTDLLEAKTDYKIRKEMQEANKNGQIEALNAQKQQVYAQRDAEIARVAQETAKALPDLPNVIGEVQQYLDGIDPAVEEIIYDLDNPSLAVYVLAKEGTLVDVLNATPALAAAKLLAAQQRGEHFMASTRAKQTPSAPEPMRGAKGTGAVAKPLESRSPNELLKWMRT
jgi:hypothetical protein